MLFVCGLIIFVKLTEKLLLVAPPLVRNHVTALL